MSGKVSISRLHKAHPGWQEKFIILPEEVPWWVIEDAELRKVTYSHQYNRMWWKKHPRPRHPKPSPSRDRLLSGSSEEELINEGHSLGLVLLYAWELEKAGLRRRPRSLNGKLLYSENLNAEGRKQLEERRAGRTTYSRKNILGVVRGLDGVKIRTRRVTNKKPYPEDGICELCGKVPRVLSCHHWDDDNFSKSLYLCRNWCHTFADHVDGQLGLPAKYVGLKADLDGLFSSPIMLYLARSDWASVWDNSRPKTTDPLFPKLYSRYYPRRYSLGVSVNGKFSYSLKPEYKRPHPGGNNLLGLCELCGKTVRLNYHHWDDTQINKGLWLCARCHVLAEVVDHMHDAEDKYLSLKKQEEIRVLSSAGTVGVEVMPKQRNL